MSIHNRDELHQIDISLAKILSEAHDKRFRLEENIGSMFNFTNFTNSRI